MSTDAARTLNYAEDFAADWLAARSTPGDASGDAGLHVATERAVDLGATPVSASVGTALSMFARMLDARTVVEVGTGCGVSGLWLLRGMRADGVLTTIDAEPENQRAAKTAFADAGVPTSRTRMISGRALEVLPRLADAAYDLVFVDAALRDYPGYVDEGVRLLRPGGTVVLHGIMQGGRVADSSRHDAESIAVREAVKRIADNSRVTPLVAPVGAGLLCAARL